MMIMTGSRRTISTVRPTVALEGHCFLIKPYRGKDTPRVMAIHGRPTIVVRMTTPIAAMPTEIHWVFRSLSFRIKALRAIETSGLR